MKTNKTAVIIMSPFQALCALEALYEYPSGTPDFYTIEDKQNIGKIRLLLRDFGHEINIIPQSSNILMWIVNNIKRRKYDRIIVGDFFAFPLLILTSIIAKWKAKVIYVDDGNTTLLIKPNKLPNSIHNFKWKLFLFLLKLKSVTKSFYTFFPIEKFESMPVTQHSFKHVFDMFDKSIRLSGVYVIGTNTSALDIDTEQYKLILRQILRYYQDTEKVYYCPHRRDVNIYTKYCNNIGIELFDTKVSVEYDFMRKKLYPHIIIGFGSTALYTLRKMFPLSVIYNVNIEMNKIRDKEIYKYIADFLEKEGVNNCLENEWER